MALLLHRLGAFAHRRRRSVLAAWLLVLIVVGVLAGAVGGSFNDDFKIPGSPSQQTLDRMNEEFPSAGGATAQVVFVAPAGEKITDPGPAAAIKSALAAAAKAPQVAQVVDPATAKTISRDGRTGLAQVQYPVAKVDLGSGSLPALESSLQPARAAGLQVETGGSAYADAPGAGGHTTEVAGLLIALVVLVVTFGAILAAGIPLLTAVLGVGTTLAGMVAVAGSLTVSTTAPTLAAMLGLAVGIDYALFIVARHRSQLAAGLTAAESAARATATAGTAVVFAGLTVVIALAGLSVVRIPFLTTMGLSAAAAVVIAVCIAITLIPALLGFAGDRLRPKPGSRAARREVSDSVSMGERWVRGVTKRPLITAIGVVVGLGIMAVPAAGLRLALTDNGSAATGTTQRQAYDLTAAAFGPGFNGPLLVLADLPTGAEPATTSAAVAARIAQVPDVAATGHPAVSADGRTALIQVVPKTGPQDEQTEQLVHDLRDLSPALQASTGATIGVTGVTAIGIDISQRLSDSLVPFAIVVVGLAFLLLMIAFRSLVVPLKAALGFLLSVGATLGAVVAVFQWGWLAGLIGVTKTGPVISFMPILLMAVLFGLAMDYEVFLVSRMHEEYAHTGEPLPSVIKGFRSASRVVAAAALIMIAVFTSFIPGGTPTLKPIAFALAFGVLLDAFLVRMTLVPAVLALAGRAAWWLPGWLSRILPDLDVEGAKLAPPAQETTRSDALTV
jgi:RND superfamily putative drug exporter